MLPLLHAVACALRSFKILRSFSKNHVVGQEKLSYEYKLGLLYSPAVACTELCDDEYFNLFHRIQYYGLVFLPPQFSVVFAAVESYRQRALQAAADCGFTMNACHNHSSESILRILHQYFLADSLTLLLVPEPNVNVWGQTGVKSYHNKMQTDQNKFVTSSPKDYEMRFIRVEI